MSALTDLFGGIADAIRNKTGGSEQIQAAQFATAISNIPTGSEVVQFRGSFTNGVLSNDLLKGKTSFIGVRNGSAGYPSGGIIVLAFYTDDQQYKALIAGETFNPPFFAQGTAQPVFDSAAGTLTVTSSVDRYSGSWWIIAW